MYRRYRFNLEEKLDTHVMLGVNAQILLEDFQRTFEGIKKVLSFFGFINCFVDLVENNNGVLTFSVRDRNKQAVFLIDRDKVILKIGNYIYTFEVNINYRNNLIEYDYEIIFTSMEKIDTNRRLKQNIEGRRTKITIFDNERTLQIEMLGDFEYFFDFSLFNGLKSSTSIDDLLKFYKKVLRIFQFDFDQRDLIVLTISEKINGNDVVLDKYILNYGLLIEYLLSERRGNTVISVSSTSANERMIVNYDSTVSLDALAQDLDVRKRILDDKLNNQN
ncbi:MAG: hypothetical protein HFI36_04145 [Bacilli bacterium]|jgi:transposase-like protein|nr:hypothetical protein [Bacilli bacterium]